MNDSGEGTKGLDLGEEDGSPLGYRLVRAFGDDLLQVIAEVGMVFHPTVSPSVSG